mgnify:CR=1 FL=1
MQEIWEALQAILKAIDWLFEQLGIIGKGLIELVDILVDGIPGVTTYVQNNMTGIFQSVAIGIFSIILIKWIIDR